MPDLQETQEGALQSFNPWYLQRLYRGIVGVVAAFTTIVFGFRQDWILFVSVLLVFLAFEGMSGWLWWHRKQVRQRLDMDRASFAVREQALRSEMRSQRGSQIAAIDALHFFIHSCRDSTTELKKRFSAICDHSKEPQQRLEESRDSATRFFQEVLGRMLDVFRPLIPAGKDGPVPLWAAIRQIQNISGKNCFVSIARQGEVNPDRCHTSEPIPENEGLPKALREAYDNGKGILIIPKEREGSLWRATPNDGRNEDLSVMAAPIVLKTEEPWPMVMILYLNSSVENAFADELKPYMKCCADTLSTVLNALTAILHVREANR
jgi:hypothetical protein